VQFRVQEGHLRPSGHELPIRRLPYLLLRPRKQVECSRSWFGGSGISIVLRLQESRTTSASSCDFGPLHLMIFLLGLGISLIDLLSKLARRVPRLSSVSGREHHRRSGMHLRLRFRRFCVQTAYLPRRSPTQMCTIKLLALYWIRLSRATTVRAQAHITHARTCTRLHTQRVYRTAYRNHLCIRPNGVRQNVHDVGHRSESRSASYQLLERVAERLSF